MLTRFIVWVSEIAFVAMRRQDIMRYHELICSLLICICEVTFSFSTEISFIWLGMLGCRILKQERILQRDRIDSSIVWVLLACVLLIHLVNVGTALSHSFQEPLPKPKAGSTPHDWNQPLIPLKQSQSHESYAMNRWPVQVAARLAWHQPAFFWFTQRPRRMQKGVWLPKFREDGLSCHGCDRCVLSFQVRLSLQPFAREFPSPPGSGDSSHFAASTHWNENKHNNMFKHPPIFKGCAIDTTYPFCDFAWYKLYAVEVGFQKALGWGAHVRTRIEMKWIKFSSSVQFQTSPKEHHGILQDPADVYYFGGHCLLTRWPALSCAQFYLPHLRILLASLFFIMFH